MRKPCRHGDVPLVPVNEIPENATLRPDNIVARGEVSGHAHRMLTGLVYESGGRTFVDAGEKGIITHEDHGDGELTGMYEAIIQREYDDEKEWRQVAD